MISKKLTSKAGITIPKSVRADLGWQPGMAVDLIPQDDGSLTIRPHINLCRFCGTHENVHKYKDVCVCNTCGDKMKEAI
ncbi:MAG: AbrB/MazE/SpoVT family DNA-binding domain-containing protein [Oscillospiraceae bacterium]|nr:AbrB/MazE/SpoVT family DNA-binding domain-containing protein [Oscillospiraceae bacterium]